MRIALQPFFMVLLAANCFAAPADPSPADVDVYAKWSQEQRVTALTNANHQLETARKSRPRNADARERKKKRIESIQQWIARLEDPLRPYYGELRGNLGRIRNQDASVVQVINDKEALVELLHVSTHYETVTMGRGAATSTNSYQRPQRTIDRELCYLEDYPMQDVVDGGGIRINGLFYKSTRQYESQTGLRTVPLLRPVDLSQYEDKFTRRNEARTWALKDGQNITDAIYVRYSRGKVELVRLNGEQVSVRLSELADPDRDFVREKTATERARVGKTSGR